MDIEIHGFNDVVHGMKHGDIEELCENILLVDCDLFKKSKFGNAVVLRYSFGKAKESIYIRTSAYDGGSYSIINLKGSFFDNSPDFEFSSLLKFISRFKHTPKQLDVAFNDDKECLSKKELIYWCKYCDDYCTGSLVQKNAPDNVYRRGRFRRIQLGSAKSKANYGTIYVRPNTGFVRIEIKLKQKDKIEHLLEGYSSSNISDFESRSLEMLVGCINFITARSKKNRVAAKYKKQQSWKSFLESDIQGTNWTELNKIKAQNRFNSDKEAIKKRVSRQATMISNLMKFGETMRAEDDIKKCIAERSGYALIKVCEDVDEEV